MATSGSYEASVQVARLLGDLVLRDAPSAVVRMAIESRLDLLAEGLTAEAAACDDVSDHASAVAYLDARIEFLQPLLSPGLAAGLRDALLARIDKW